MAKKILSIGFQYPDVIVKIIKNHFMKDGKCIGNDMMKGE